MTKYHIHIEITGAIKNAKMYRDCITVDGRLLHNEKEIKAFLREQLAMGRKVLPVGDCGNFDYQKGCMGHSQEAQRNV